MNTQQQIRRLMEHLRDYYPYMQQAVADLQIEHWLHVANAARHAWSDATKEAFAELAEMVFVDELRTLVHPLDPIQLEFDTCPPRWSHS